MNSAIEFTIADFPGYAEAVERENAIRGASCLGINEVICGLEVLPLCAAHVRLLSLVRSPFMGAYPAKALMEKPDVLADIMRFLWIVSPQYQTGAVAGVVPRRRWFDSGRRYARRVKAAKTARDRFNEVFAPILKQPADKVIREILEYIDEAYTDADDSPSQSTKSYYAFEISIAHEMHEHYGYRVDFWNPDCPKWQNPLLAPLKIVFQLRKLRAQIAHGAEAGIRNKSDKLVELGLANIGRKQAEKMKEN